MGMLIECSVTTLDFHSWCARIFMCHTCVRHCEDVCLTMCGCVYDTVCVRDALSADVKRLPPAFDLNNEDYKACYQALVATLGPI